MTVLYRKYRPTKLEDVVGQEQVTSVLSNAIKSGKIAHAFLFIGPRGTGKTSVARILAHAVNGFDYKVEDSYLDIIEIDAASNTGVDNIRELREKAVIAPTKGKYKVYIIDEVHMLTKSASNALLKTLEEPPEHVIFIMATTDAHKVPITISSRTQVHTFKLASPETMLHHLQAIATAEHLNITDSALEIIVRRGGGSFRDSLSLLDQVASLSDQEITADLLNYALGLPQSELIDQLLQHYLRQDQTALRTALQDLLNAGLRPETLVSELITKIIASPQPAFLPLLSALPDVAPPFPEAKLLLALLNTHPNSTTSNSAALTSATNNSKNLAQTQAQTTHSSINTPQNTPETTSEPSLNAPDVPEAPSASTPPSHPTFTLKRPKPAARPLSTDLPTSSPPETQPQPTLKPTVTATNFDWDNLLDRIQSLNNAIYAQLTKVEHEFDGTTLHIYPLQRFSKTILDKPGNIQIISQELTDIQLVIHEVGSHKKPEDHTISQISAIMGNVQEVNGDSPF